MCIGVGASDGGQRRERSLDGDQVGDDLDGLGVRFEGIGPAGDLVQVRTRPTDRRTRSDSVNPAERAFACHSARSASLAEHQRPESRQGIV